MTPENAEKCHLGTQTLTRRLIKPQPPEGITGVTETVVTGKRTWCFERQLPDGEWEFWHARPPYFRHDAVAIAETHWRWGYYERNEQGNWRFVATDNYPIAFKNPDLPGSRTSRECYGYHKRPARFMPYDLARTYWKIVDVRPERLQDISFEDVYAEGIRLEGIEGESVANRRGAFKDLWDSINAKKAPWKSNPWVWRLEGRKVTL
jgi:hypothetical protein